MEEKEKALFEFAIKNFPKSTAIEVLENMGKKIIASKSEDNDKGYRSGNTEYRIVYTYLLSCGTIIEIQREGNILLFTYSELTS